MPIWLTKLRPSPWLLRKLLMLAILVGVGVGSFFYGRRPHANASKETGFDEIEKRGPTDPEYFKRVVAYLYDDRPIYRAELGEYLIQRFGAERLEFMVNRRIVEMECAKYNVTVSDGETRTIGAGEVLFVEDTTGKGHLSKAVSGQLRHSIFIPVE